MMPDILPCMGGEVCVCVKRRGRRKVHQLGEDMPLEFVTQGQRAVRERATVRTNSLRAGPRQFAHAATPRWPRPLQPAFPPHPVRHATMHTCQGLSGWSISTSTAMSAQAPAHRSSEPLVRAHCSIARCTRHMGSRLARIDYSTARCDPFYRRAGAPAMLLREGDRRMQLAAARGRRARAPARTAQRTCDVCEQRQGVEPQLVRLGGHSLHGIMARNHAAPPAS
mmetsp:Transcript_39258/g.90941  ORF Transcript_39258/g.90941 Transcript_39258/m.90941 type:complete len:224 (-) Transcript_39258:267-938(-)